MYTLDSNILIYAADEDFPLHSTALTIRNKALKETDEVRLCYPVLLEFFAVITDPKRVRNPLPPREAWDQVKAYLDAFTVLYPDEATFAKLDELVCIYRIRRQDIFDALIVALMLQYGVKGIYTANARDFARFREIEVLPWP